MIDNLEDLGDEIAKQIPGIDGPIFTDHGYIASRTMTFWAGTRRAHFYFETHRGVISIIVEIADRSPKGAFRTGKLGKDEDAFKVVDLWLKRKKAPGALPDLDWVPEAAHDELVPHPPGKPAPGISVSLVGKTNKEGPATKVTTRKEIVTKVLSRPTRIAGLHGMTLYSKQPDKLAQWYRAALGIDLQGSDGTYNGKLGDSNLSIVQTEGKSDGVRVLFTLRVDGFAAFVEQLAVKGVEIAGLDRTADGQFAYVRDLDGNPIEITGT